MSGNEVSPQHGLPARPNLEHLKSQARTLLRQSRDGDLTAAGRMAAWSVVSAPAKLADALHVIAREHGFANWPALKLHVEVASEDAVEALTAAVKANSAALVRTVLARHPELRRKLDEPLPKLDFDTPALIAAVSHGNREMIDVLLEAGADINVRTRWWAGGFGVLDLAKSELAEYLIARGAHVDLHAAARLGMTNSVRELLAGAPHLVHARGGDGQLPLHFAATVEIAGRLVDAGADLNGRDIDHESTAVQYMVSMQPYRFAVARYLIARGAEADILAASALGDVALVEKILNDDPETVRTTVSERSFPKRDARAGGSIYIFGFGFTKSPHLVARQFGHGAVFDLLMQRSAPWLRLIQAAEAGDEALAARVLQQQPALLARLTANAARRIIGVAVRDNAAAVEMLLGFGWPPGPVMENGQTALHYAAWHGNLRMVQALLRQGAAVNVFESEHGGTPLSWALHGSQHSWRRERGDYAGVVRELLAAGAKMPPPEEPLQSSAEVLEVLREHAG